MRILFVTPYLPSLIRPRAYNFIKQLSRRHEVTLASLTAGDPGEERAISELRDWCANVHLLSLNKRQAVMSCAGKLLSPMPLQAAYTYNPSQARFLRDLSAGNSFDLLHVEHIRGAHLTELVSGVPQVYDSVDCITRLLKQKLDQADGILDRALSIEEIVKMRTYEPRVARRFHGVVITSEHDKRALTRLMRRFHQRYPDEAPSGLSGSFESRVSVVRNGVDSEYFQPRSAWMQGDTVVFSGKMSYFANVSAVLWFYNQVLTIVRRSEPNVKFKIVGSNPPPEVMNLARDPSVEVTGYVTDIRPHLASAALVVCPLTIGVGIQNKVLEAMSMAKPVIATSMVRNGIPGAEDGRHIQCADAPDEMATAVLRMLRHPEYGCEMGTKACRLVRTDYNWEAATGSLVSVYDDAVGATGERLSAAA